MSRPPEQRLKDAQLGKWYGPIPFEQISLGAKINKDAVKLALEDVLSELRKNRERKAP